jgi:hypothetical protein
MRWCLLDKEQPRVLVRDRIDGDGRHEVLWRFHLDPAVTADMDGSDVRLSCDNHAVWLLPASGAGALSLSLENGWVSPGYGVKLPTTVVVWSGTIPLPIDASFLFAELRLSREERAVVRDALVSASMC